jgi:hypothetical protein
MIKNRSKNSLYPHSHFTEHLLDAYGKSPWEHNLNHEFSSLLIRRLNNYTEMSSCNNPYTRTRQIDESMHHSSKDNTAEENRAAPGEAVDDCAAAAQQRRKNHR